MQYCHGNIIADQNTRTVGHITGVLLSFTKCMQEKFCFVSMTYGDMLVVHLLAGKLAEHRGYVAGILRHLLLDGLFHSGWDAAGHASHDVLKLQQWQRWITHVFHEPLHPLFQLG